MKKKNALYLIILLAFCLAVLGGCVNTEQEQANTPDSDAAQQADAASTTTAAATQQATRQTAQTTTAATQTTTQTTPARQTTTRQTAAQPATQPVTTTTAAATSDSQQRAQTSPPVSLQLTRSEYPKVDGSTATIPLSVMLASAVTGMSQLEAEAFISHSRTTQSFYNLALGEADLLIVYEPPEFMFEDIESLYNLKESDFIMTPIGRDALIFLVNEQNPVKSLTRDQIIDIYTGKITDWSELVPGNTGAFGGGGITGDSSIAGDSNIVAFQRNRTSGSQVMMENLVMNGIEMMDAPVELIPGDMEGLVEGIADYNNSGNAIGYSVYYYFNNMYNLQGVRALDAEGVPCANEAIRSGAYPFTQDFYAVIRRSEPAGSNARKLFNLLTGIEGAMLIEASGYVAVMDTGGLPPYVNNTQTDNGASREQGRRPLFPSLPAVQDRRAARNLFPISQGNKTGFVDGDGEWVIKPVFDTYSILNVYYGDEYIAYNGTDNFPLYYYARMRASDGNAAGYLTDYHYSVVIGPYGGPQSGAAPNRQPGGYPVRNGPEWDSSIIKKADCVADGAFSEVIMFESYDSNIMINEINLADGALSGYHWYDGSGQYFAFKNGTEKLLSYDIGEYLTIDVYGGDRRVMTIGTGFCYLTDIYGDSVSNTEFDSFFTYGDGVFIMERNGRSVSADKSGKTLRVLPDNVIISRWHGQAGLYSYMTRDYVEIDGVNYSYLVGLMDSGFRAVTPPMWNDAIPIAGGKAFIVSYPYAYDERGWNPITRIVDASGKIITEKDYQYIYSINSFSVKNSEATDGAAPETEYFQGINIVSDDGMSIYRSDIIDNNGNILFSDTEKLRVYYLFNKYVVFDVTDNTGKTEISGIMSIDDIDSLTGGQAGGGGAPRLFGGLSGLLGGSALPAGKWLLPPEYRYIWQEGASDFLIAYKNYYSYESPEVENNAVFDITNGEILFTGEYHMLSFAGYKYADISGASNPDTATPGRQAIFNAATSTRKGLLSEKGEWIFDASRFDTFKMDD